MSSSSLLRLLLLACAVSLSACSEWFQMDLRQEFNVRGVVRGVSPDGRTLTIQHEKIPGYAPERTMDFAVRKRREAAGLRSGHGISFRLIVAEKGMTIDRISRISAEQVWVTRATASPAPMAAAQGAPGASQP